MKIHYWYLSISRLFHLVADITQKLKERTIDIVDTYQNIDACIEDI